MQISDKKAAQLLAIYLNEESGGEERLLRISLPVFAEILGLALTALTENDLAAIAWRLNTYNWTLFLTPQAEIIALRTFGYDRIFPYLTQIDQERRNWIHQLTEAEINEYFA